MQERIVRIRRHTAVVLHTGQLSLKMYNAHVQLFRLVRIYMDIP